MVLELASDAAKKALHSHYPSRVLRLDKTNDRDVLISDSTVVYQYQLLCANYLALLKIQRPKPGAMILKPGAETSYHTFCA